MSALLSALLLLVEASAPAAETLAKRIEGSPPSYPTTCLPPPGVSEKEPQSVVVTYVVSKKGEVEDARIRESSDPCFNEVALATVKSWRFEPRRVNGEAVAQEDYETTIKYVYGGDAVLDDFDARPIVRVGPKYPFSCANDADDREHVHLKFDVTAKGIPENIVVVDTTNRCFKNSAIAAVRKWVYQPKRVNGAPVARPGVEAMMTYNIAGTGKSYRTGFVQAVRGTDSFLTKKGDPQVAFARIAEIERKFGADFSREEQSAFHQLRARARLLSNDKRGALDDLRLVERFGLSGESAEGVTRAIAGLEAQIAAEDAKAAADAAKAAEPPK